MKIRIWLRHWYLVRLQAYILRCRRKQVPEYKIQRLVERHEKSLKAQLADRRSLGIVEIENSISFEGYGGTNTNHFD